MHSKYVIVYVAPAYVCKALSASYARTVGRELPVTLPHISLSFPFFLQDGFGEEWLLKKIGSLSFPTIGAWLTTISHFSQLSKKILHVTVEPAQEFIHLQKKILPLLRGGIDYDITVFDGGRLPAYSPHLTLDYDFDGDGYTLHALNHEKIEAYFDISALSIMKISGDLIEIL